MLMVDNDPLDAADLVLRYPKVFSQFYSRIEPELRLSVAGSDVDVHARLFAGKEEEPIRSFAEDRWAHEQTIASLVLRALGACRAANVRPLSRAALPVAE